jgi:hypothetical protein
VAKDTHGWGREAARRRYAQGGDVDPMTRRPVKIEAGGGGGGGGLRLPKMKTDETRGPIGPPSGTHPDTGEPLRPDKMLLDEKARGYYRGPTEGEPYNGMRRNQFWRRIVDEPLPEYRRGGSPKKGRK